MPQPDRNDAPFPNVIVPIWTGIRNHDHMVPFYARLLGTGDDRNSGRPGRRRFFFPKKSSSVRRNRNNRVYVKVLQTVAGDLRSTAITLQDG